jgi:hypothetical protein
MKTVKIIGIASEICWWIDCVGQTSPVLEIYEPTGFIKIRLTRREKGFEDEPYEIEGWIDPQYVEMIE